MNPYACKSVSWKMNKALKRRFQLKCECAESRYHHATVNGTTRSEDEHLERRSVSGRKRARSLELLRVRRDDSKAAPETTVRVRSVELAIPGLMLFVLPSATTVRGTTLGWVLRIYFKNFPALCNTVCPLASQHQRTLLQDVLPLVWYLWGGDNHCPCHVHGKPGNKEGCLLSHVSPPCPFYPSIYACDFLTVL